MTADNSHKMCKESSLNDEQRRDLWIRFACAALGGLVANNEHLYQGYSDLHKTTYLDIADSAAKYATAMLDYMDGRHE